MVILAVHAAQKHPDPENLSLLAEAVAMLGDLPELPTRNKFDRLVPENFDLDEDDEVILDPDEIDRPLQSESAIEKKSVKGLCKKRLWMPVLKYCLLQDTLLSI